MSMRYNTTSVYCGPTTVTGNYETGNISQFHGVYSTNFSVNIIEEETIRMGDGEIFDSFIEVPRVELDLEYYPTDMSQERLLGLSDAGGRLFDEEPQQRDFFIRGQDADGDITLCFGNMLITSYSIRASVGQYITSSASLEGFNALAYTSTTGTIPHIDSESNFSTETFELPDYQDLNPIQSGLFAYRPQDIAVQWANGVTFGGMNKLSLQSFNMQINFPRQSQNQLGKFYPYRRPITYPIRSTISADFIVDGFSQDEINNFLESNSHNMRFDFNDKCINNDTMSVSVNGARLEGVTYSMSIDNRLTASANWSLKIGNIENLNRNIAFVV